MGVAVSRPVGGLIPKRSSSQESVQATSRILSNVSWDNTEGSALDVGMTGVGMATSSDGMAVPMATGASGLQV